MRRSVGQGRIGYGRFDRQGVWCRSSVPREERMPPRLKLESQRGHSPGSLHFRRFVHPPPESATRRSSMTSRFEVPPHVPNHVPSPSKHEIARSARFHQCHGRQQSHSHRRRSQSRNPIPSTISRCPQGTTPLNSSHGSLSFPSRAIPLSSTI